MAHARLLPEFGVTIECRFPGVEIQGRMLNVQEYHRVSFLLHRNRPIMRRANPSIHPRNLGFLESGMPHLCFFPRLSSVRGTVQRLLWRTIGHRPCTAKYRETRKGVRSVG